MHLCFPQSFLGYARNEECSRAEQISTLQEIMKIMTVVNIAYNPEPGLSAEHSSSYLTAPEATIIKKKII